MDAHSLAVEMAPTLLCRRDERKFNFQRRQLPLWHTSRIFGPISSPRASDRNSNGTWTGERSFDDLHDPSGNWKVGCWSIMITSFIVFYFCVYGW